MITHLDIILTFQSPLLQVVDGVTDEGNIPIAEVIVEGSVLVDAFHQAGFGPIFE